jgi:capsular exopolysaccharide synthesis family protein
MISNIASLKRVYAQDLNSIMVRDKELSRSLVKVPEVERNLVQITRDKDVMEQLYFFLLQKREENSIALAGSVIDSRLVDSAKSEGQISPKSKPVWLAALFAGLLIPIIFVLLKDALDNTVGDKSEIEHSTMAPVLGEISYIRKLSKKIVIGEGDRSAVAEQFRTIRTQLEFTSKGRNLKRILVTSHRPGEGKSFTSLNLAASYTLLNKKVLILEFDLRKPRLAKYLDLSKSKGISSYLSGKAELDELIMEVPGFNGNFFIISAGPIPPNPAELINGDLMEKFMLELNERFDIIILDTPPFGIVADPTLLEKFADISVVVLRQGFSLKMVYNEINSRISAKNDPPMYTILNGVGMQKKYAYGYESYLYGYGYYSDDKDKKKFSIRQILDKFKI